MNVPCTKGKKKDITLPLSEKQQIFFRSQIYSKGK